MSASLENSLETLADSICGRGLGVPAVFFLELTKPLVGCMRELYGMSEPLQRLILGREASPGIKELLSSGENVEQLIQILEARISAVSSGL